MFVSFLLAATQMSAPGAYIVTHFILNQARLPRSIVNTHVSIVRVFPLVIEDTRSSSTDVQLSNILWLMFAL